MTRAEEIFLEILKKRGISEKNKDKFLKPSYNKDLHDPYKLPDMEKAVNRIKTAIAKNQNVVIYGDYDIDGMTASALLQDALGAMGIRVKIYIPDRFNEGYGLNLDALKKIKDGGADLVITVDCGSTSRKEVKWAEEHNLNIIVTDHHNPPPDLPSAAAVINPKRQDSSYPFRELAGVGVAFKLVQALQNEAEGLSRGQEKWLLDLVALGTVCDIVQLKDENRALVYWGLKVLKKTKRIGIRALAEVAGVDLEQINTVDIGFKLGPRLNAAGRLKTADASLKLLTASDREVAMKLAYELDKFNTQRRDIQDSIFNNALEMAHKYKDIPVVVLSDKEWSHGVVGIAAAKLMQKLKKPVFLMQEIGDTIKGSARSFGDFSVVDAIRKCEDHIITGGGHNAAGGLSIRKEDLDSFRTAVNEFYDSLGLEGQREYLSSTIDVEVEDFDGFGIELADLINRLEPFGPGNDEPVFKAGGLKILTSKQVGNGGQHTSLMIEDKDGRSFKAIAFNMQLEAPIYDESVSIMFKLKSNYFNGNRYVDLHILGLAN